MSFSREFVSTSIGNRGEKSVLEEKKNDIRFSRVWVGVQVQVQGGTVHKRKRRGGSRCCGVRSGLLLPFAVGCVSTRSLLLHLL